MMASDIVRDIIVGMNVLEERSFVVNGNTYPKTSIKSSLKSVRGDFKEIKFHEFVFLSTGLY